MNMQHNDQNQLDESDKHQIRINDLPGEVREIADLIGLKFTMRLIARYSGESIYFPKHETVTRAVRNRAILELFDGSNFKELARKFNLSTTSVRDIIKGVQ